MYRSNLAVEKSMSGLVLSEIYLMSPINDWINYFCSLCSSELDIAVSTCTFFRNGVGLVFQSALSAFRSDLAMRAGGPICVEPFLSVLLSILDMWRWAKVSCLVSFC